MPPRGALPPRALLGALLPAALGLHGGGVRGPVDVPAGVADPAVRHNIYADDGVNEKESWLPARGPRGSLDGWTDRLLLWPEKKFAFCWMDKNAGSQFNLMMNRLNNITKGVWWASDYKELNAHELWKYHRELRVNVSREDGWRFGTFLRDPAERFLSAWLSKCQDWEDAGRNCLGKRRVPKEPAGEAVAAFEEAVRDYLPAYMRRLSSVRFQNAHYDPQWTFCGGVSNASFDFVGRISKDFDSVHKQVFQMMRDVAKVPADPETWDYFSELFPESGNLTAARTNTIMRSFYRSTEIYRAVQDAYRQDYEKLGIERLEFHQLAA